MKKRQTVLLTAAASAVALVLAGCGTSNPDDAQVEASESGSVEWWGYSPDTGVAESFIAAFNEEYPDIDVTFKRFETLDYRNVIGPGLDSGTGPDVYNITKNSEMTTRFGPYAIDLEPFAAETLGDDWESSFSANYAEQLRGDDGRLVGLPSAAWPRASSGTTKTF